MNDPLLLAACAVGLGERWGLLPEDGDAVIAKARAGEVCSVAELIALAHWLFHEYEQGHVHVDVLERLSLRRDEWDLVALCAAVNQLVCVEVAAGRYRQALAWRERVFEQSKPPAELDQLLRINEAEALANLGRWEEALTWPSEVPGAPQWVLAGLAAHRAWVLGNLGKPTEARAALERARASQLAPEFQSEWHFAEFSLALCTGDFSAAEHALAEAARLQVRPSTRRNVIFYQGLLEHTRGQHAAAVVHFAEGASHEYRGQGGESLLAWGDSLRALGREAEALAAFRLCLERDAQSPAAVTARARLA